MTTSVELEAPLRALVENRLDAIERVLLLAGVARGERRGIVEEVEAQFYELLARRAAAEPTRADVLAVLAALDPPEAYAPEGYRERLAEAASREQGPRIPQLSLLAIGSAVGGVFLLLLAVLAFGMEFETEWLLSIAVLVLGGAAAVTACGFVSIGRIRRSGGWLFGLPAALFAALLFPLVLGNALLVATMLVLGPLGLYAMIGLGFVAANGFIVFHAWKAVSAGYRRATPEAEAR
jgi:hypothetical protein